HATASTLTDNATESKAFALLTRHCACPGCETRQNRPSRTTRRGINRQQTQVTLLCGEEAGDGGSRRQGHGRQEDQDALGHEDRRAQARREGDDHGQKAEDLRRRQAEEEQAAEGARSEGREEKGG
ncbi:unnamed protein product, partial [Scytosiphon promiscuus]